MYIAHLLLLSLLALVACASPPPSGPRAAPLQSISPPPADQPACGEAADCLRAAERVERGADGREPDLRRAQELYEDACQTGSSFACRHLATWWADGSDPRPERSAALFKRTLALSRDECENSDHDACGAWIEQVEFGIGVDAEPNRALTLATEQCEQMPRTCLTLAELLERRRKFTEAAAAMQRGCDAGSGIACTRLARYYRESRGVSLDLARAESLDRRFQALILPQCQSAPPDKAYSACLVLTMSAPEVAKEARAALARNCERGHLDSCLHMTEMTGVVDNRELLEMSCTDGGDFECQLLATKLQGDSGQAARVNELRARVQLLREAECSRGVAFSCEYLLRDASDREPRDVIQKYAKRAIHSWSGQCERGYGFACGQLAELLERTTFAELADKRRAMAALERKCQLGDGCTQWAEAFLKGRLEVYDRARAYEIFRQGCADYENRACAELLGMLESDGKHAEAQALKQKKCTDDPEWCHTP